ncbi:class I SAM-dependent methyltransferase [Actinomyces minihominis]|uniref:class I SAM-dependent methyltransferase n=1 Tax=Actinomyces minihominis TaxID=2002838 RepID=UPI001F5C2B13|nr:class I SAM-dependent methyltransferase [Actinomyces minihominis]
MTEVEDTHAALINPFDSTVGLEQALEYEETRPGYPDGAYRAVLSSAGYPVGDAVDIGAGTGQFTRGLLARGIRTTVVEPSSSMRETLRTRSWAQLAQGRTGGEPGRLVVTGGTAEQSGLPECSSDVVVWAQCSHWLDVPRASAEAARILRPEGSLALVANQLAVEVPWVHRLSRIMRSGDVVRRDRTPDLGPRFTEPELTEVAWEQSLTVEQCMRLARTRSSYLAASPKRQAKMQDNLAWYLLEHLGFDPVEPFGLPYTTMVWTARVRGEI